MPSTILGCLDFISEHDIKIPACVELTFKFRETGNKLNMKNT